MTGKENVTRAIEYKGPEYLPVELGYEPRWMKEKDEKKTARIDELAQELTADIVNPSTFVHHVGGVTETDGHYTWTDEWGTGWEDDGYGSKAVTYPMDQGWEQMDGFPFPDSTLGPHIFLEDIYKNRDTTKYLRTNVWFTLFERLWMLRGFENTLLDPHLYPQEFETLRDRIVEFSLHRIDQWAEMNVDGMFFSDDFGTQRGLLISPEDFRTFYKPAYKTMYDRVHAAGAHVWMHLCGDVRAIIPDLIEVGVDVINPIQPLAMDVKELVSTYGREICFNGGVDVQQLLVNGSTSDVKRAVYDLVALFDNLDGGYVGATSHTIMPETPLDNIIAMYEAFRDIQRG